MADLDDHGVHPFAPTVRSRYGFTQEEESHLRYMVVGSATLSVCGSVIIMASSLKFWHLARRFFAIRLIFFLALTDFMASVFNTLGAFVDVHTILITETSTLCYAQALGLLYFNLASILWTSCFAFTLHRDVVPTARKGGLHQYELYFHAICWPIPAVLALTCLRLRLLGDSGSWCAIRSSHAREYLLVFYLPLVLAFCFNCATYVQVWAVSVERRVVRATSLYLLAFAAVWAPSLVKAVKVYFVDRHTGFALAALEALCMPLQGALNAAVYGWSLPSIRDFLRSIALGTDESSDLSDGDAGRASDYMSSSSLHDDMLAHAGYGPDPFVQYVASPYGEPVYAPPAPGAAQSPGKVCGPPQGPQPGQ